MKGDVFWSNITTRSLVIVNVIVNVLSSWCAFFYYLIRIRVHFLTLVYMISEGVSNHRSAATTMGG